MTQAGDVTRETAVSGIGRTALALGQFLGEGLRHTPEPDAWREYDGKTAELPDAKAWAR